MRWPLSRRWTIIIIAILIPLILWIAFQLWQGSQTAQFGKLPGLQIITSNYAFNRQIVQDIGRSNASTETMLRKVYQIERRVVEPADHLRRLGVQPVTVNSSVNAYENKTTGLLVTHDKSTNTLILLPSNSDQSYQKESADNSEEAVTRCREVIQGLQVLNQQDFASAQSEVGNRGGSYRVWFWRSVEQEPLWYSAAVPALADCIITPAGKVTNIVLQLDELSVIDNSRYQTVSLSVSAYNIMNSSWPWSIDLFLAPEDVGNNYTLTPNAITSVTVDEIRNVSMLSCRQQSCYTYPGYQVKATLQVVSTGVTGAYPGYARLYLPSLDPQYWE